MNVKISLPALRTLAIVAEQQSFTRAANLLCISASAVSHQMKLLEQQLGYSVFQRQAHGVQLTPAGTELARYASRAMQQLSTGLARASVNANRQRLTVAVTPSFGQLWLQPRLSTFYHTHGDIELQLVAQDTLVDFNQQQIDLHLHFGDGQAIGLKSHFLLAESAIPVCHPQLRAQASSAAQLLIGADSRLLHYQAGDEDSPGGVSWNDWLSRHNLIAEIGQQHSYFSHLRMALDAANWQQGTCLAWSSLISTMVNNGQLVTLADTPIPLKYAHYIVAPEHHWQRPAVKTFCDWLQDSTSQTASF